jgi:hypothetical protein
MRKSTLLLVLGLLALLGSSGPAAAAQGFADLPGLQRGVVRAWLAPATAAADGGTATPTTATPMPLFDAATMSGTIFLSIGVFEFDSGESATGAFESLATYVSEASDSDPQFAGGSRSDLGLGDQSLAATSTVEDGDIPFSYLVAVVRQDNLVFLLQGTFVRLDPAAEAERLVMGLLAGAASEGAGTYDAAGGSTGGLWDIFSQVEPVIVPGTEVLDGTIQEP